MRTLILETQLRKAEADVAKLRNVIALMELSAQERAELVGKQHDQMARIITDQQLKLEMWAEKGIEGFVRAKRSER